MAKTSKIAQNERRREIVAHYAERRAELKRIIKSPSTSPEAPGCRTVGAESSTAQRQPGTCAQPRLGRRPTPRAPTEVRAVARTSARVRPRGSASRSQEVELVRRRLSEKAAPKKRRNLLKQLGVERVDYKDTSMLRQFISERGKIRSRTVTGLTVQQQRQVTTAIKNAREMALLPYPGQG